MGRGAILEPAPCDVAEADTEAVELPPEVPPAEGKFDASPVGIGELPGPSVAAGPLVPETVILPLEIVFGNPDVIPEISAAAMVGKGALGSIVQALVPAVDAGQAGAVVLTVAA